MYVCVCVYVCLRRVRTKTKGIVVSTQRGDATHKQSAACLCVLSEKNNITRRHNNIESRRGPVPTRYNNCLRSKNNTFVVSVRGISLVVPSLCIYIYTCPSSPTRTHHRRVCSRRSATTTPTCNTTDDNGR